MARLPDERETTAANLIVVGGDELSGVNLKGHADNSHTRTTVTEQSSLNRRSREE